MVIAGVGGLTTGDEPVPEPAVPVPDPVTTGGVGGGTTTATAVEPEPGGGVTAGRATLVGRAARMSCWANASRAARSSRSRRFTSLIDGANSYCVRGSALKLWRHTISPAWRSDTVCAPGSTGILIGVFSISSLPSSSTVMPRGSESSTSIALLASAPAGAGASTARMVWVSFDDSSIEVSHDTKPSRLIFTWITPGSSWIDHGAPSWMSMPGILICASAGSTMNLSVPGGIATTSGAPGLAVSLFDEPRPTAT